MEASALLRLQPTQLLQHRLQCPLEQQAIVQQAYLATTQGHGQAHAVPFAHLHAGAVAEDQPVVAVDTRHQLAAQRLVVVHHLDPGADLQPLYLMNGRVMLVERQASVQLGLITDDQHDIVLHPHFVQRGIRLRRAATGTLMQLL
ncbi:hypothetical protein WR25_21307 [Diploscapter pachys]|uniref:Uncharacterized protein n=1 Tax=Diploscapter pachys TaxID=2018661 RepID=A0A2A2M4G2_9BILA|nr:hypothetical protein WR25_21307 [Diploscapter pachys]